jgi:hypothetical protein
MGKPEKCVCGVKDCPKCKAYKDAVKQWVKRSSRLLSFEEQEILFRSDRRRQDGLKYWHLYRNGFPKDDGKLGIA